MIEDLGNIGELVAARATIASPLKTIRSIQQKPNWTLISQQIEQWEPIGLVVGISRH